MEARVAAYSQSNRLRDRMAEAGVRAVSRPRFGRPEPVKADVFFCTMGPVQVRRVVIEGDGRPLPDVTILDGLDVPREGTYDLLNVLVRSNGDLRLIVDEASRVGAAHASA